MEVASSKSPRPLVPEGELWTAPELPEDPPDDELLPELPLCEPEDELPDEDELPLEDELPDDFSLIVIETLAPLSKGVLSIVPPVTLLIEILASPAATALNLKVVDIDVDPTESKMRVPLPGLYIPFVGPSPINCNFEEKLNVP